MRPPVDGSGQRGEPDFVVVAVEAEAVELEVLGGDVLLGADVDYLLGLGLHRVELRVQGSNLRPPGYEPGELTTAPTRNPRTRYRAGWIGLIEVKADRPCHPWERDIRSM